MPRGSAPGRRGGRISVSRAGTARPLICGLPLTTVSARKVRMRVARSRRSGELNSSGVSSMKRVV
jgi:hypothetical protein